MNNVNEDLVALVSDSFIY